MKRIKEIEKFLKYYAKIYHQNPNLVISSDTIYNGLMNYDFTKKELLDDSIKDKFNEWIEYFRFKKNLNVYYTEKQQRFLQFTNADYVDQDCVKLYLSFPKSKISECVKIIFDYIERNNMPTLSKVADIVRSDAVVLRMFREDDAKRVIEFINNTPIISKFSKRTNPFLFNLGNVGLSCDYYLSYNEVVSLIVKNYFQKCRNTSTLTKVNFNHFREYVANSYLEIFDLDSSYDLSIFFSDYEFTKYRSRLKSDSECLTNYYQIFTLFHNSLNPRFSEKDYFSHFNWCNNLNARNQLIEFFNKKINIYNQRKMKHSNSMFSDNNKISLLYDASMSTLRKYEIEQLYTALKQAQINDFRLFTNDGDNLYRDKLVENVKPQEIELLIKKILIINEVNYNDQLDVNLLFCQFLVNKLEFGLNNKQVSDNKIL